MEERQVRVCLWTRSTLSSQHAVRRVARLLPLAANFGKCTIPDRRLRGHPCDGHGMLRAVWVVLERSVNNLPTLLNLSLLFEYIQKHASKTSEKINISQSIARGATAWVLQFLPEKWL